MDVQTGDVENGRAEEACDCLELVPLPGSIRCVVGGCVLFEWWGFVVWSVDCVLCEVIFGEMVVECIGEEEFSLFVECGEGG
eukprot:scaffold501_cov105-Isochrysis_galbana.AAC.15